MSAATRVEDVTTPDDVVDVTSTNQKPASSNQEPPKKRRRLGWVAVSKKVNNKLAFLQQDNLRDLFLLRQINTSLPWSAGFGNITRAWEEVTDNLNKHVDADGECLYGEPLSVKHVKDRFDALIKFGKNSIKDNPFLSGADDEDPPTEILTLIEELEEIYSTHLQDEKEKNDKKKNQSKKNREQAEAIRNAALGRFDRDKVNEIADAANDHSSATMKEKAEQVSEDLDLAGLVDSAKAFLSPISSSADLQKETYQERRLDLQARRLDLDEKELDMRREDRLQDLEDRKLDREERRAQMENSTKMQETLLAMMHKLADK